MVQGVTLFRSSGSSLYLGKMLKGGPKPSSVISSALPVVLGALTFFVIKNKKKDDLKIDNKILTPAFSPVEYSAWARLKDLRTHEEESDYNTVSRDSNKWNEVFRNR